MRFARLIVAVVPLILTSASLVGAQPVKPTSPNGALVVIDSNGTVVGPLLGPNSVGIRIDRVWFQVTVLRHVLRPTQIGDTLYFESADCSSDPLMQASELPPILVGYFADAQAGTFRYFYAAEIRARTYAASAQLQADGSLSPCNPAPVPTSLPSGVMTEITLPYAPPFSVR